MSEENVKMAKPLLKEFGITNTVGGTLACMSLWMPSFRLFGLYTGIYGFCAGLMHIKRFI